LAVEGRYERRNKVKSQQHMIRHNQPYIMLQKYYKQKPTANADCKQSDETAEHIITACPIVAKEQYLKRHNCELIYTLTYKRKWW
jgi:hypothetical protein